MGARALTLTRIDMDEALVSRQIHLLYQPIFSLTDGGLDRVEALVRWDHPRFGTMLPAVFLPAFEAEDRLTALTRRILERAAAEFASWAFRSPSGLSINLAVRDCTDPSLPTSVKSVLEATHLTADKLTFECPVKVSDAEAAGPVLRELKDLGVRLAAEMMGRTEDVAEIFEIAPFDEIKTGGRGILRAARQNHTASLTGAADLIAFAEERGATVTAIGAEDEAACQALRTVGFHHVQANVLSAAVPIDGVTPKVTNAARRVLGLDDDDRHSAEGSDEPANKEPGDFRSQRLRMQAEALKRAALRKAEDDGDDEDIPRGAKAMQNALSESFGEDGAPLGFEDGPDAREQQEILMQADSKAGLLMRPDLASLSLGYGTSPLRPVRKEGAAVIVVEPGESDAKRISKEPEVAEAITKVLKDLPTDLADRTEWEEEQSEDAKADALDAEVAKLPPIADEDAAPRTTDEADGPEDLLGLAARLRPEPEQKNFLQKKYKLKKVTHFWPKPWKRAFLRFMEARNGLGDEEVFDRLSGQRSEEDTVSVMSDSVDHFSSFRVPRDERTPSTDEGPHPDKPVNPFGPLQAR